MDEETAQFRQLQANMNTAFEKLFQTTKESPSNTAAITAAKEEIGRTAQLTFEAVLGPIFSVLNLSKQHHAYAAVRIALDLELFEFINKSTSLDEIVQKTKVDPVTLQRILRAISSIGYLKQTAVTQWEPTPLTQVLKMPSLRDWLATHFDHHLIIAGKFPEWLRKRGYKPTTVADEHMLMEVLGEPLWSWYDNHPAESAIFNSAMSLHESFPTGLQPPYPFSADMGEPSADHDAITFVDIGGGLGQVIKKLRAEYPNVRGRFILQDLPNTISQIDAVQAQKEGFEAVAQDFFEPQAIKGAKYYHLRRVLHAWNDESSIKILEATRVAMEDTPKYSRLLIHEFVLPDVGCGFNEAMYDLMMWQCFDGMERTESHWRELLEKTGFKVLKIWRADQGHTAVIEAAIA